MANVRQAAREARQASEDAMHTATEEAHRVAATAAEASAGAARASAQLMQRNVETVQRAWESAGDTAGELTARSMRQLARASGLTGENTRRATEQSCANLERILQSSTVIASAMQSISREWLGFAQKRMHENFDRVDHLMSCRTPQELFTAQSDLVRNNIEDFLQSTRRVAEISLQMANDAADKMEHSLAPK